MANHENDVSVSERQIFILSLLSENPIGFTIDDIAEKLKKWGVNVTRRTIQRDIDELSLTYSIEEEERGNKTYYFAKKFSLENVDLTGMDLMSLAFLEQIVVSDYASTTMGKAALNILQKMSDNAGKLNQRHLESLKDKIQISGKKTDKNQNINSDFEKMVSNAIDEKLKLEIEYYSWNSDSVSKRVIHPLQFKLIDGYLNVEAFCELRNEIRSFRLSRMHSVRVLNEHFELPEGMEPADKDTFIFVSSKEKEMLQLLFDEKTGRYVKEYHKDKADKIKDTEEGLLFEKTTGITDEVIRFVMQFGSGVKVLKPEWLANRIQEEAEAISKMYRS